MKNMKALLTSLVTISVLFELVACSSGGGSTTKGTISGGGTTTPAATSIEPKKQEQVMISFDWWGDAKRNEKYNSIADMFEKQNPNVKIERQFGSFGDYWDKLATQTAGGNAPDVIGMSGAYLADYATRGALLDLEPYLKDGTIDLINFPDSVKEVGKFNGKTIMVAQGVTMSGWEYNQGAFEKLGVKAPDFNWTWDDFFTKTAEIQKAIKASSNPNRWASVDASSDITGLEVFARQRNTDLFKSDGKLGITKKDMVDWFSIWDKLRKEKMIPDASTNEQYSSVSLDQGLFVKGKVFLTTFPFNQIPLYQNYVKDGDVQALRRPLDPNGKVGEFVEGAYFSVSSKSKHPKEAAAFINFFVNNVEAQKTFKLEQGALGSTKGNEAIKPSLSPAELRTLTSIETVLKTAGSLPLQPKGQGTVWNQLKETAQAIAFGKITVDQGAQEFIDKATAILNK